MEIGDTVVYVDPVAVEHDALLTAIWGPTDNSDNLPSVNLVFVDGDKTKTDSYGRQIARQTSVVHQTRQAAHGNYWHEK